MTNGRIKDAQSDAILAGGQDAINEYVVHTLAEILQTCQARPVECAATRSRAWTKRRTIIAWSIASLVGLCSVVSLVISIAGHWY